MTINNYTFQSLQYRTRAAMLRAIAEAWLGAGADVNPHALVNCADQTDDEIAAECIRAWALDEPTLDEPAHMELCDYTAADLAVAIGELRAGPAPGAAADLTAILERLEPTTPPSRRYNRVVSVGTVEVLELRDANSGTSHDPATKPRHQFTATTDGTTWCRVLPPITFGDEWADTGAPRWEPVAHLDGIIAEAAPLLERAPLLRMRRQAMQDGQGFEFYRVQGEDVDVGDAPRVELACGPVLTAWHEVPLPPCPDCGGAVVWAEAGNVPGTRECQGCGSLFTVLPDHEAGHEGGREVAS